MVLRCSPLNRALCLLGEDMQFYKADEYQASCENLYRKYELQIAALLPDATIEHIGASSIPNAVSKGDLDILVGVNGKELENAVKLLSTLGFNEKSDTLRTPELCMLENSSGEDVAFQVVANGSEFEFFVGFRDNLRKSPELVQRYNELKMSCTGAIVKCGVWRSCSSLLMSLHFFHSIDEANIFHYICEEFKTS